jgi:hypothetical protein
MKIFISKQGRQLGPYTHEQLQGMLRNGTIEPNDWAWYEGAADWKPLHTIPGYVAVPVVREDIYDYYTPRRPVLVWIICVYYVISTVTGLFFLASMPFIADLKSGTPGVHDYLAHETVVDYAVPFVSLVLNLVGAVLLFRMRRQALYWFGGNLALSVLHFGYQLLFHNALFAAANISTRLFVTMLCNILFVFVIRLAVVVYVGYLYQKRVLR